jgi:shikimate 5-dehydrogenase
MLIQQAKVAFEKVFNQTPDVSSVYKFLEERYK